MSKPMVHYNTSCLRCGKLEKEMVRVGILTMCNDCFMVEFHTDDPVEKEKQNYYIWVKIYKKKSLEEI
jgi:hypothetical protein